MRQAVVPPCWVLGIHPTTPACWTCKWLLSRAPWPLLCTCLRTLVGPGVVWCGVMWCGVVWCGVVWCGLVWCGVVWCGVVWCGVVWCGVVWCCVVWCGVVWCGVVWCGVVWCGVVWCGVVWYSVVWCGVAWLQMIDGLVSLCAILCHNLITLFDQSLLRDLFHHKLSTTLSSCPHIHHNTHH